MASMSRTLEKFFREPPPKDVSWSELVRILGNFGFDEKQGSGSRVRFIHVETGRKILLHKRHPDSTLLEYQINDIKEQLCDMGLI